MAIAPFYKSGLIQVIAETTTGLHLSANVMYLQSAVLGPFTQTDIDIVASELYTIWIAQFVPLIHVSNTFQRIVVNDLSSSAGLQGISGGVAVSGGVTSGVAVPANTAFLLSLKTTERYRGGHGRIYLAGAPGNQVLNGDAWLGSYVSSIQNAWDSWVTAVGTVTVPSGGFSPVVLRRKPKSPAVPHTVPITKAVAQPVPSTQRRRMR